jgi:hypothetical protein
MSERRPPPPKQQAAIFQLRQVTSPCCSWPKIPCHQNDTPIGIVCVDPQNQTDDTAQLQQVCQTCVRKESLRTAGESCRLATFGTHRVADHSLTRVSYCPTSPCVPMHCFSTNPWPVQGKVDVLALFESLAPGRRGSPQVKWMDRRPLWPTVYGSVAVVIA